MKPGKRNKIRKVKKIIFSQKSISKAIETLATNWNH